MVALALAVGYCVLQGGRDPASWSVPLLAVSLTAISSSLFGGYNDLRSRLARSAVWAGLLFPAYVAFQLVPVTLPVLQLLSPTRAEVVEAVRTVASVGGSGPLSIRPAATSFQLSLVCGYALIFLIVQQTASRSHTRVWALGVPLIAIGAAETVWGLAQRGTGIQAIYGTAADRDLFAGILEMVLPLALMYGITVLYRGQQRTGFAATKAIKACGVWCIAAALFVAILFSFSKMGFAATLGSLLVMVAIATRGKLSSWNRWAMLAGLSVTAILALVFITPIELVDQLGTAASDPTGEGRYPIWKDTLHLIAAYPLFGAGFGNFGAGVLRYQTAGLNVGWAWAHNDYLQLLAEMGLVGFLIPATLIIAVFVHAVRVAASGATREIRFLGLACAGSLTALLLHSITNFSTYIPANAMVTSWIVGMAAGLPGVTDPMRPARTIVSASFLRKVVFGLGCLTSIYAGARVAFAQTIAKDPRAEQAFCRLGVCDTDGARAALWKDAANRGTTTLPKAELVKFLRREPAGPANWCDLGDAFQKTGQTASARYCFSRALTLGPNLPYILYRTGRYHLDLGETRRGLELIGRAFVGDFAYANGAFEDYEQRGIDTDDVLRYGLPDLQSHQEYFRVLVAEGKSDAARRVWQGVLSRGYADNKLAREYGEFLTRSGQPEAAVRAWAEYVGARCEGYLKSTYIFNGDFELDLAKSLFDWQFGDRLGFKGSIDDQVQYAGHRSARISFDGTENVKWSLVSQSTYLPAGRYTFSARMKSDALTTNQGPFFEIVGKGLHVATDQTIGSSDWGRIEVTFEVPADAGLLDVRLTRRESLKFDNKIKGTLWVDDVAIMPSTELSPATQ